MNVRAKNLTSTSLMGWCMAGQHGKECRTKYVSSEGITRICGCHCHDTKEQRDERNAQHAHAEDSALAEAGDGDPGGGDGE